jgi:hypothetical protein
MATRKIKMARSTKLSVDARFDCRRNMAAKKMPQSEDMARWAAR